MYLLDTSAIIELIYGTEKGNRVRHAMQHEPISISSLTLHELMVGLKEREVESLHAFFADVSVQEFDAQSALQSARIERELRKKGALINKVDILLAGSCLAHNLTLVTCDGDFAAVSGLQVLKIV